MKTIGYMRDENGDFHGKEKAIKKFARNNELVLDEIYAEKSGCEIEELAVLNQVIDKYENIILLVSDISDVFECDEYILIANRLYEKGILLIDTGIPSLMYEDILEKPNRNPNDFLQTALLISTKAYMRKVNNNNDPISFDIRSRISCWKESR